MVDSLAGPNRPAAADGAAPAGLAPDAPGRVDDGPSTPVTPLAAEQQLLRLGIEIARPDVPFETSIRRIVDVAQGVIDADRTTVRLLRANDSEVETLLAMDHRTAQASPPSRAPVAQVADWRAMVELANDGTARGRIDAGRTQHLPLRLDDVLIGFLSFDAAEGEDRWPTRALDAAHAAAQLVVMAEAVRLRRADAKAGRMREQIRDAIVEAARDYIFVVNRAFEVSYVNAFAAAAVGKRPDELTGGKLSLFFPPSTLEHQQRSLRHVLETGTPLYVETETAFPGGSRWLDSWLLPMRGEDGQVHSVVGISRDTTDRKRTEQALRQSEALYRTLIDLSPDSISMTDLDGHFLLVNRRGLEMHGAESIDELHARRATTFDIVAPADRERAKQYARETVEQGQVSDVAYHLVRKDGSLFPVELNAATVPDEQGRPKAFISITRDVSARQRAEQALAAEKERLQVTLASIAEGVVTTDREGRVELLNRVAEQLTGWTLAEARGRPIDDVLCLQRGGDAESEPDTLTDALGAMAAPKRMRRSVLISRDGTQRKVAASAAPIRATEGGPMGVAVVFHDVTERDKLEREVQRVESLESVGILAAGVAHDVNNIMTAILGNVSLAKALAVADPRVIERLAEAERAIARAKDLTQQLLGFARGTAPEKRTADIAELIRETARFAARGSSSAVSSRVEAGLWAVDVDEAQITQVVSNLVINALQAQRGGGTVEVKATNVNLPADATLPLPDGPYVKVAVRDHGVGIPPEDLARIFDPYFTTKAGGSGLGLTICHAIVRNHGGHLTADSRVDEGTTFLVYLPASQAHVRSTDRPVAGVLRGQGRILVVDDDRAIREVSELMLQFLGYDVETASDGEQAIATYQAALLDGNRFVAVVLDLTMPGGLAGDATMARLLEIDPSAVGVVASGYSEDPVMVERSKYGFRGAVAKPFRIEELSQVLAKAIRSRGA